MPQLPKLIKWVFVYNDFYNVKLKAFILVLLKVTFDLYASIFLSVLMITWFVDMNIWTALNSMLVTCVTWLRPTWGRFFSKTIENIFLNFLGQIPLTIQSCDKLKELVEIDREWEYFVKILWLTWLWN